MVELLIFLGVSGKEDRLDDIDKAHVHFEKNPLSVVTIACQGFLVTGNPEI